MFNWRAEAECKGTASDLFVPEKQYTPDKQYRIDQEAKSFCEVCIVREECLEYAVSNPTLVTVGTWGGKTYKEIKRERRKRSRI